MGRRKKTKDLTKITGIVILILILLTYLKLTFLNDSNLFDNFNFKLPQKEIQVTEHSTKEDYSEIKEEAPLPPQEKSIEIFFTKNSNSQDIYTAVQRIKKTDNTMSDIEFAVKTLLKGPNKKELSNGLYSEIPSTTKLISIKETSDKIIINLSSDFEFGGGGNSLYTRMYQLIKTVNKNTTKPVYLYINGKQANVIGGEGLVVRQPLKKDSLDD